MTFSTTRPENAVIGPLGLDDADLAIVRATQHGLPLDPRPYDVVAERLGLPAEEVRGRIERMLASGVIRRIAAVPNHYRIGYRANAMSVWDVDDAHIRECGRLIGGLELVSHCYHRPRRLPDWRYNLFAMVHGREREEVRTKIGWIATLLGGRQRAHAVLFSRRILKKTGFRLPGGD